MATLDVTTDPASASAAEDLSLLARVTVGDREAFRRLYSSYHRRLHRFLVRVTRDRAVAEEIINDTMLVVWQRAGDFRGASRVSTWILGIAYRRALKTLARIRNTGARDALVCLRGQSDEQLLDSLSLGAETHDWIDAALAELSPEQRLVIELAYFLGLSCEEIAAIARCPVGTVKTRMFHARQKMRETLMATAAPAADEAGVK